MDISTFKAPCLTYGKTRLEALKFLNNYVDPNQRITDIDTILEVDLGINIVPMPLRVAYEVDAILAHDCSEIRIDLELVNKFELQNRYRFSLAHEAGHIFLHKKIIHDLKFKTVDEYKEMIRNFPPKEYGWLEKQANDFAGLILVPDEKLEQEHRNAITMLDENGIKKDQFPKALFYQYVSAFISDHFNVASKVVLIRMQKNGLISDEDYFDANNK